MLRLEMLPATCGDCLWLEYGEPDESHVVIIDGGVRKTATLLRRRMEEARRARNVATLVVELLVVTHIDNDHIEGIIELLALEDSKLQIKDLWFNGVPQLSALPPLTPGTKIRRATKKKPKSADRKPADLMGSDDESVDESEETADETFEEVALSALPADLLGTAEGDELSRLLERRGISWNQNERWKGNAILVPENGSLPSVELPGKLKLTLLAPSLIRLHELCTKWDVAKTGREDEPSERPAKSGDILGRSDTWPPEWKNGEASDPSFTNGSSITLLAEYGEYALLLGADAFAADLVKSIERLKTERKSAGDPFKLSAFKLSHHGSDKNLTQKLLEIIDCDCFLVSTDGSTHRHPDHQALLRILKYSKRPPRILFNYDEMTTEKWRDRKADVLGQGFKDYTPIYRASSASSMVLNLP